MPTITIEQMTQFRWKLVNEKGNILKDDIHVTSVFQAEDYVKAWVSSFLGWDYAVKPLKKESQDDNNVRRR